jgi:hypothetical protein
MGICIETNGRVLTVAQLTALEDEFGEDAERIVLAIAMVRGAPLGLRARSRRSPGR